MTWQHTTALIAGAFLLTLTPVRAVAHEDFWTGAVDAPPALVHTVGDTQTATDDANTMGAVSSVSTSDQLLIDSAKSAAPLTVSDHATIVAVTADGQMRVLQKGTNRFTCVPDDPTTPGTDPMCADPNAWQWALALMGHKDPPKDKIGFMFMMRGGTDASNTDPFATRPEPGNHWIATGQHVMIVGTAGDVSKGYPRLADPDTSQPYVMYPGTPYEHLMIPVGSPLAVTATQQ
jgi:hypothetical protein